MCARILIVEDDTGIRDMIASVLADEGHLVTAFALPPAESRAIVELAPDLLVVDLMFGRIPAGLDLIRSVRREPGLTSLPIVMCTAAWRAADPLRPELDALGVILLAKPFDIEGLFRLVGDLVNA